MDQTPTDLYLKLDEKTALVVRIGTFKERTKAYVQGGYVPSEAYMAEGNPLLLEPNTDFPEGLAFGKAATLPPERIKELIVLLQRLMLTTEFLKYMASKGKTTPASTPAPAAKESKPAQKKGKVLGSNRIAPKAEPEDSPEF